MDHDTLYYNNRVISSKKEANENDQWDQTLRLNQKKMILDYFFGTKKATENEASKKETDGQ